MNGIIKRIGYLPETFRDDEKKKKKIRQMAKQVESVYCYSIAKSVALTSLKREDPKLAHMVSRYQTERHVNNRIRYYALAATEQNGGPIQHFVSKKHAIEMLENYSQLGRPCFNQAFSFV